MINERLLEIYNKYCENKNSHVYLVETNDVLKANIDIKTLLKKINDDTNISNLIENDTLPTLKNIFPDGQEIKISQIEELINLLNKIPVITKENYFIINYAEKLNSKSGNSLLKVIEDPVSPMIGFFICNSLSDVMPTIQSRAQYISVSYQFSTEVDEQINVDADKYIEIILNNEGDLLFNKYIVDKYKDINSLILLFNVIYEKISKNTDINNNSKICRLIIDIISNLNNNCNANLLLDKFLIEVNRL